MFGNFLFRNNQFERAIEIYEAAAQMYETKEPYYNISTCYYCMVRDREQFGDGIQKPKLIYSIERIRSRIRI